MTVPSLDKKRQRGNKSTPIVPAKPPLPAFSATSFTAGGSFSVAAAAAAAVV